MSCRLLQGWLFSSGDGDPTRTQGCSDTRLPCPACLGASAFRQKVASSSLCIDVDSNSGGCNCLSTWTSTLNAQGWISLFSNRSHSATFACTCKHVCACVLCGHVCYVNVCIDACIVFEYMCVVCCVCMYMCCVYMHVHVCAVRAYVCDVLCAHACMLHGHVRACVLHMCIGAFFLLKAEVKEVPKVVTVHKPCRPHLP